MRNRKKSLNSLLSKTVCIALMAFGCVLSEGCAPVVMSGAATGAAMVADRRTSGTIIDDKSIEVRALHALNKNKTLWNKCHITAVSYNNVLLLVGQASTSVLRDKAEQTVANLPRVRTVYNEITIEKPISMKQRAKDTWITTQMKARLVGSRKMHPTQVKVITENNVIYLMGLLTPAEEEEAVDLAQQIKGVERVIKMFEPA